MESEILKDTKGLTRKQSLFTHQTIIEDRINQGSLKAAFHLHAQLIIETGVNNYWKLKAIDSIRSSV